MRRRFLAAALAVMLAGCSKDEPRGTASEPSASARPSPVGVASEAVEPGPRPLEKASPAGRSAPLAAGVTNLQVVADEPTTFATNEELQNYGYVWGPADGIFGAIHEGSGRYKFFGGAAGGRQCRGSPGKKGIFSFDGTLDRITDGGGCRLVIPAAEAPPGWLFDSHYAGGGQVMHFGAHGHRGLLMVFRGEYHWENPQSADRMCDHVPCYFSSLGLAVSADEGRTFRVAGQILQLDEALSAVRGGSENRNVGYGSMVVADVNGRHLPNPPPDPSIAYFYLFFFNPLTPEYAGICATKQCTGLARARYEDVVTAVTSENPHALARAFRKYDTNFPDPWSQSATGGAPDMSVPAGKHTPLWTDEPGGQMVLYDRAFNVYLMVVPNYGPGTVAANRGITVRASEDLLHWTHVGRLIELPGRVPYYLTMLGETEDPTIGGPEPRLYFTSFPSGNFPNAYPNFKVSIFQTIKLHLSRGAP